MYERYKSDYSEPLVSLLFSVYEREGMDLDAWALFSYLNRLQPYFRSDRTSTSFQQLLHQEVAAINATAAHKEWRARVEALAKVLFTVSEFRLVREDSPPMIALEKVLANPNWRKRTRQLDAVREAVDNQLLAMYEIERLDLGARKGEVFVAPISTRDDRTIVPDVYYSPPRDMFERELELYRQLKATQPGPARNSLQQQLTEHEALMQQYTTEKRLEARQAVLRRLEEDVRAYMK
ncbi:MAG: hypothetical protein D6772_00625 [Bacteroidetes bacterium]|nr:MAG: hypothetical protein D6772_00625 [Bacteroidota bacterium]